MQKRTHESPPETPAFSHALAVPDLSDTGGTRFDLAPGRDEMRAIAAFLGLDGLRKLRFRGALTPEGKLDWALSADLGATVVQPCVVTSEPVTTRIDTRIRRRFVDKMPTIIASETEFDGDEETELLESVIDLGAILVEALALALPDYPRKPGAQLSGASAYPQETGPLQEEETRPFAQLADLLKAQKDEESR